ncbi:MAG: 3-oxoacyl-ACP reductase [Nevskiales bacterium]
MSDYLLSLSRNLFTGPLVKGLGVPTPHTLARAEGAYEQEPLRGKRAVFGAAVASPASEALKAALKSAGASIAKANGALADVAVFDATGLREVLELRSLYYFFHAMAAQLAPNARVLVVADAPDDSQNGEVGATRRAVEGFVRSLAKEIGRRGATANLAFVEAGAEQRLEGVLRFLLSPRSAYVSGQPFRISARAGAPAVIPFVAPLKDKVALVTGAARGIGAATARRLAEEGAQVVCLDVPAEQNKLEETAGRVKGTAFLLDVTEREAPRRIADFLKEKFDGVDIVVHNAGVTRDKTIAKMEESQWHHCLAVNLESILRIDRALIEGQLLRAGGRIVCLSSIAGVAGNVGQTNYAATKAGVIGYVAAQAQQLASRGICVNAVAPGYIETRMMLAVPFLFREFVRRLNSLVQGGVPLDVAELITFLATPGAVGVTGQTLRVCGQNLIGA